MRPAGGARPALQDRAPKLGAVGPALAPRRDEGKCCVFSPVEMFLRRLEGGLGIGPNVDVTEVAHSSGFDPRALMRTRGNAK
jgi:hypothetical protein